MLSEKSLRIIELTLPLIGARIGEITPRFYARLFAAHPELLDGMFNRSNQQPLITGRHSDAKTQLSGRQQQALAGSIAVFAAHLVDSPDTLPEQMLTHVANKHGSLGVTEEQYQLVYEHLFAAIAEDLEGVLTPDMATAWTEVYWLMAHALIKLEKGLYDEQANNKMWTPWRVVDKRPAGLHAVTLTLEPADDTPATPAHAGQYVGVKVPVDDGTRQVRQYSLSADAGTRRIITVKLIEDGEVSPVLYHRVQAGDTLELSNPFGEITLKDGGGPVVLASAGIGCAHTASILRSAATQGTDRDILVLHADTRLENWALRNQMTDDVTSLDSATLHLWLEQPEGDARPGFMSLRDIELPDDATLYLCGPVAFMKKIRREAIGSGIPADRIHYELFGPDTWLAS
jgi:nitric oxide dioxygenase